MSHKFSQLTEEFENLVQDARTSDDQTDLISWLVAQLTEDTLWTEDFITQHDKNLLEDLVNRFFTCDEE